MFMFVTVHKGRASIIVIKWTAGPRSLDFAFVTIICAMRVGIQLDPPQFILQEDQQKDLHMSQLSGQSLQQKQLQQQLVQPCSLHLFIQSVLCCL